MLSYLIKVAELSFLLREFLTFCDDPASRHLGWGSPTYPLQKE